MEKNMKMVLIASMMTQSHGKKHVNGHHNIDDNQILL